MKPARGAISVALIGGAALMLAAGGLYYRFVVRDQIVARRFDTVETGKVYRSGRLSSTQVQAVVREHGIRTIIDLGAFSGKPIDETIAANTARALGVDRFVFRLHGDGTGNPQDYVEALKIATDPARQPVLIHCAAGTHRTSVCVILYKHRDDPGPLAPNLSRDAEAYGYDQMKTPATAAYLTEWGDKIRQAWREGATLGNTTMNSSGDARAGDPIRP